VFIFKRCLSHAVSKDKGGLRKRRWNRGEDEIKTKEEGGDSGFSIDTKSLKHKRTKEITAINESGESSQSLKKAIHAKGK